MSRGQSAIFTAFPVKVKVVFNTAGVSTVSVYVPGNNHLSPFSSALEIAPRVTSKFAVALRPGEML